jgi:hypothetical protein
MQRSLRGEMDERRGGRAPWESENQKNKRNCPLKERSHSQQEPLSQLKGFKVPGNPKFRIENPSEIFFSMALLGRPKTQNLR